MYLHSKLKLVPLQPQPLGRVHTGDVIHYTEVASTSVPDASILCMWIWFSYNKYKTLKHSHKNVYLWPVIIQEENKTFIYQMKQKQLNVFSE